MTYSAIVGGAPTPVRLWTAMKEELGISAPSIGYGCTEAAPGLTHLPPGLKPEVDGQIGHILDKVRLKLLPEVGLEFNGPQMCVAMVQDGKLIIPDSVLLKDHIEEKSPGSYLFRGRYDLVLNRGGQKISLERTEDFLREEFHREVLCVSVKDERLGEELGVLLNASVEPPRMNWKEEFKAALKEKFGFSLNENRFLEVKSFPTNASYKLDRKAGAKLFP